MVVGIILSSLAKIVVSICHFHNLYFIISIQSSRLGKACIDLPLYLCDFAFVFVLGVNIESIRGLWLATAGVNSPSGPHHHYLVHRSLTNKFMKTKTSIMANKKTESDQIGHITLPHVSPHVVSAHQSHFALPNHVGWK